MLLEMPVGFRYRANLLTAEAETVVLDHLRTLPFSTIEMRGQLARRRTIHFGWIYGYESWQITPGPPIPPELLPLREQAADFASVPVESLAEVLVNEYPVGAGIGWHRDAPQFGTVIGVSLLAPCRMRFQRGVGARRETRAIVLERCSAYVLDGEVRWQWQHSVPPVKTPRYSITFRTLRQAPTTRSGGD
jgi:alkylated DNA repair dioxygenase AlkB